jgi:hypothetical protein
VPPGSVIVSVHIADVGRRTAVRLLRTNLDPTGVPGLRYAEITTAAPLSGRLLPRPDLGRVGLIAAWDDDRALDAFLAGHPVAGRLAHGWHVCLQPTRIVGAWSQLQGLLASEEPMEDGEPAAVLTLGRLRLSQGLRFLRASAAAEELAMRDPALLAATGLARAPALVATFSLWRSVAAMRAYAGGHADPGHSAAVAAHAARPFHHESAFVRLRPYSAEGVWDGLDPLARLESAAPTTGSTVGA